MNENTTRLLEKLAEQLGTTSEYLWGVLVRQAPISATISLVFLVVIFTYGYVLYRIHMYLSRETDDEKIPPYQEYYGNLYQKHRDKAIIPMAMGILVFLVMFCGVFYLIRDIVNGLFNPEYWALREILKHIK